MDDDLSLDDLRRTVQHQADTIESLHMVASKYKNHIDVLEQQVLDRDSELGSMSILSQENAMLRQEILSLRESLRTLEHSTARIMDKNTLGTESQAQLGVRVQAYQRHNAYLQGELSERESKIKFLQEKVDQLTEENHTKDRRIAVMLEKLRQHNIDPTSTVMTIRVPEDTFSNMKVKLTSQASTIELLHERIDGMLEEAERKQTLIDAVQRENKALRTSISKLIAQVTGQASESLREGGVTGSRAGADGGVATPTPGSRAGSPPRRIDFAAGSNASPAAASGSPRGTTPVTGRSSSKLGAASSSMPPIMAATPTEQKLLALRAGRR